MQRPHRRKRRSGRNPATTLTILASVTELNRDTFQDVERIESVVFAADSQLRELPPGAFSCFYSLKSICLPASVEILGAYFLAGKRSGQSTIQTVTFEPGSKLREIKSKAFWFCEYLRSFCLPRSVEVMTGESLPRSPHCRIQIEPENPFFHVRGSFLVDSKEMRLVRYLGGDSEPRIPLNIEAIGDGCFTYWDSVGRVDFGSNSQLSSIGSRAFDGCFALESIAIPSSVVEVRKYGFCHCRALSSVSFGAHSKLNCLGKGAFGGCKRLTSIVIPSQVDALEDGCFWHCKRLVTATIERDSKLCRINASFLECFSLKSFIVPSLVESIGESCFESCYSLSEFCFESPCHLRELYSLPPIWPGAHDMPDSIEVLAIWIENHDQFAYRLNFGRDSKLKRVVNSSNCSRVRLVPGRSFLHFSSRSLKCFRARFECEADIPRRKG
jgi:hypothetical protein